MSADAEGKNNILNYHDITKDDMLNGDGLRAVLWLSGCEHHCEDCQNPLTWDKDSGLSFDEEAKRELFEILGRDYISGLTLSGGDPLFPGNRREVAGLVREVKTRFPSKNIWLYTGYLAEEILSWEGLPYVDVLVDGKYDKVRNSPQLPWRGSDNQRVIDAKRSLASGGIILHCE